MVVKITCEHPVAKLRVLSESSSAPDGYGGDTYWNWTVLSCSLCNSKSKTKLSEERKRLNEVELFERAYFELKGKPLRTEDDANQLELLRENPALFWQFEPSNAKYLVPHVPVQWEQQQIITKLLAERQDLARQLREKEIALNKALRAAERPERYFRLID